MPEMKRNSSNQSLRALEEGKYDRLKQLPYISQRQHVQWLTFSEQGRNQIDLANEIEKFFNYVTVSMLLTYMLIHISKKCVNAQYLFAHNS
jgi:hypothetical protein